MSPDELYKIYSNIEVMMVYVDGNPTEIALGAREVEEANRILKTIDGPVKAFMIIAEDKEHGDLYWGKIKEHIDMDNPIGRVVETDVLHNKDDRYSDVAVNIVTLLCGKWWRNPLFKTDEKLKDILLNYLSTSNNIVIFP